tara:strand:+ start:318 stop:461 length:144 start_codon:yes stop_codon:yes gene_type:complete
VRFFSEEEQKKRFPFINFLVRVFCGLIELFVLSWKKKTFIDAYNFSF